jgi:hypothetical protein
MPRGHLRARIMTLLRPPQASGGKNRGSHFQHDVDQLPPHRSRRTVGTRLPGGRSDQKQIPPIPGGHLGGTHNALCVLVKLENDKEETAA